MPDPQALFETAPDPERAPFLAAVHSRWRAVLAGDGDSIAERAIRQLSTDGQLEPSQARAVMERITAGEEDDETLGVILVCTSPERLSPATIAGFAEVMRERARRIQPAVTPPILDTCGTGGDAFKTVNVSTAAALVVAAEGVVVAKHGNRGITSGCGSADVLAALGVNIELEPADVQTVLEEVGIAFLFAPRFHPAMKHVQPTRMRLAQEAKGLGLKLPTVFNVLGPLTNPAGATHQVLGVMSRDLVRPVAEALAQLGTTHSVVVHGEGPAGEAMDELSPFGTTHVCEVHADGSVQDRSFTPAALGLLPVDARDVAPGPDVASNAERIRAVLAGAANADAELVALNAGVALWIAGRADDPAAGIVTARSVIASGRGAELLERFAAATSRLKHA